jgi:hypothetical protein
LLNESRKNLSGWLPNQTPAIPSWDVPTVKDPDKDGCKSLLNWNDVVKEIKAITNPAVPIPTEANNIKSLPVKFNIIYFCF